MNMGLRGYLAFIGIGTLLAGSAWGIIFYNVNPYDADFFGFAMFYTTLALALVGALTFIMTLVRVSFLKREVISREVLKAFRHAVLFAVIAIASLILAASDHLTLIALLGLIAFATIVEYFFLQFK
jgi:hypothetical protein